MQKVRMLLLFQLYRLENLGSESDSLCSRLQIQVTGEECDIRRKRWHDQLTANGSIAEKLASMLGTAAASCLHNEPQNSWPRSCSNSVSCYWSSAQRLELTSCVDWMNSNMSGVKGETSQGSLPIGTSSTFLYLLSPTFWSHQLDLTS